MKSSINRWYVIIWAVLVIVQFGIFKTYYPFVNLTQDSDNYLLTAHLNQDIGTWPVGYSKFLRFFSAFTHADIALAAFQYLFLQVAGFYFLVTVQRLFTLDRLLFRLLFVGLTFNPLFIYLANYISPDAFFTALSIIWITQLIIIWQRPSSVLIALHILIILLAFAVGYHAVYYPVLSIGILSLCKWNIWKRGMGISILLLTIIGYAGDLDRQRHKMIGEHQLIPAAGWQLATNGIRMFNQLTSAETIVVPNQFKALHAAVVTHKDSLYNVDNGNINLPTAYYLNDVHSPLMRYWKQQVDKDTSNYAASQWMKVGALYADYGWYLLKLYPGSYMQSVILADTKETLFPSPELLAVYNMEEDTISHVSRQWFTRERNKYAYPAHDIFLRAFQYYPVIGVMIQSCLLVGVFILFFVGGFTKLTNSYTGSAFIILLLVWLSDMFFLVLTSSALLRHEVFLILISSVNLVVCIDYLLKTEEWKKETVLYPLSVNTSGKSNEFIAQ
ncbi:hypothetical protein [Chitinophaga nivalis]|uniref:Glycosyltransferase RgtA/B/C/D-like domain-containing protein n=1 Tax=Chitinophaga nivalis TaxID=2991709 RepID=A0ABT3IGX4_9BACT|nr:hypothetical protein [Chitinophaga nivalis]MCW3467253.1 hypothetical protein [Chitinophaga nivalis]MCW3483055.1 hypothetical protein [Chitinophaga nivalis]